MSARPLTSAAKVVSRVGVAGPRGVAASPELVAGAVLGGGCTVMCPGA